MLKRTRTILFSLFLFLFLVSIPILVMYAQGYRMDIAERRIVKTGGISVKALPYPIDIFVDGQKQGTTNLLFQTVFVSHLLPHDYLVEARKEGYQTWKKTLPLKEGEVTEALDVHLYPTEPRKENVAERVSALFPEPQGKFALLVVQNTQTAQSKTSPFSLVLFRAETNDREVLASLQRSDEITRVVWAQDAKTFFVIRKKSTGTELYFASTTMPSALKNVNFIPAALRARVELAGAEFFFNTNGTQLYLFLPLAPSSAQQTAQNGASAREFFRILLDTHTWEPLSKNFSAVAWGNGGIFALEKSSGLLFRTDAAAQNRTILSFVPLTVPSCALAWQEGYVFADCARTLFLFDDHKKEFQEIASGVTAFSVDPSGNKVAIATANEVRVYWLKKIKRAPHHEQGDMELILRLSKTIENISWLDAPYSSFAVLAGSNLSLVELDSRDGRNIVSYPGIQGPLAWFLNQKTILARQNGNLVKLFLDL